VSRQTPNADRGALLQTRPPHGFSLNQTWMRPTITSTKRSNSPTVRYGYSKSSPYRRILAVNSSSCRSTTYPNLPHSHTSGETQMLENLSESKAIHFRSLRALQKLCGVFTGSSQPIHWTTALNNGSRRTGFASTKQTTTKRIIKSRCKRHIL
jgi:hypothetical protein